MYHPDRDIRNQHNIPCLQLQTTATATAGSTEDVCHQSQYQLVRFRRCTCHLTSAFEPTLEGPDRAVFALRIWIQCAVAARISICWSRSSLGESICRSVHPQARVPIDIVFFCVWLSILLLFVHSNVHLCGEGGGTKTHNKTPFSRYLPLMDCALSTPNAS